MVDFVIYLAVFMFGVGCGMLYASSYVRFKLRIVSDDGDDNG